uniref:Uncharacterized protein n=1 Tax=Ditylum brightwellii TaxID=49249 RepID=A0A7S4TAS9_9STRA
MPRKSANESARYDPVTMSSTTINDQDTQESGITDEESDRLVRDDVRQPRTDTDRMRIVIGVLSVCAMVGIILGISLGGRIEPPDDLLVTCSPNAVSTKEGFSKCKLVCAQAECCNVPKDHPESCATEQADACEAFDSVCTILSFDYDGDGKVDVLEHVHVPPADLLINELCQWDRLQTEEGYKVCEAACKPGNCCSDDIDTCTVTNPDACKEYAACQILHVQHIMTIPPADPQLEDLCAPEVFDDHVEYNKCKEACTPASCCLEPDDVCKVQNPELCSGYDACGILHGTPKSHPLSVESQVLTKCNTAALSSAKEVGECENLCEPAMCCFNGSSDACDKTEHDDWCDQYAACQTLEFMDNKMDAKAAVQDACSDTSSPSGLETCTNVCAPAICCFDDTQNCIENGMNNLRCSHYEVCGVLYENDKDPNTSVKPNPVDTEMASPLNMVEEIAAVCTEELIVTPDGREECMNLCEDNLCCFAPGSQNCLKDHGETCVVYAGCSILTEEEEDNSSPPPPPSNNNDFPDVPSSFHNQISERCLETKLNTQEGFTQCYDICKRHFCCFSTDPLANCYNDHTTECDDFMLCSQLITPVQETVVSKNAEEITKQIVDGVCDATSIQSSTEGFENCRSMCADHLCCFSPGGMKSNCIESKGVSECLKYKSCSNLIVVEEEPPVVYEPNPNPENKIPDFCGDDYVNVHGDQNCRSICKERQCCLYEGGEGNCIFTNYNHKWCEGLELCLNYDDVKLDAEINSRIYSCNVQWSDQCDAICKERSCCLQDGDDNCIHSAVRFSLPI